MVTAATIAGEMLKEEGGRTEKGTAVRGGEQRSTIAGLVRYDEGYVEACMGGGEKEGKAGEHSREM